MSENIAFVVGMIAGAIAIDYLHLRYTAFKNERQLKSTVNASQLHKPLTKLRLTKGTTK